MTNTFYSLKILQKSKNSSEGRHTNHNHRKLVNLITWTTTRQASLSITNSWSLPKLMSIESVMSSNHLILCCPLLLLLSIFPGIRDLSNESALRIRPKYWSFNFNIHNWVLFLLWLHPFILSGVISPLISSSILGT